MRATDAILVHFDHAWSHDWESLQAVLRDTTEEDPRELEASKPHSHGIKASTAIREPIPQQDLFAAPVTVENPEHKKMFEAVKNIDVNKNGNIEVM